MKPKEVFNLFVAAINHHDVPALTSLMTSDHNFIDSLGRRVIGAASMETGWRAYISMCSDYWILAGNLLAKDGLVPAVGQGGGSIDGASWQAPTAWKAVIREDKVAEWQVFADNKPVYEILASDSTASRTTTGHTRPELRYRLTGTGADPIIGQFIGVSRRI